MAGCCVGVKGEAVLTRHLEVCLPSPALAPDKDYCSSSGKFENHNFVKVGGGACGRISLMGGDCGMRELSGVQGLGRWVGHRLWQACK